MVASALLADGHQEVVPLRLQSLVRQQDGAAHLPGAERRDRNGFRMRLVHFDVGLFRYRHVDRLIWHRRTHRRLR